MKIASYLEGSKARYGEVVDESTLLPASRRFIQQYDSVRDVIKANAYSALQCDVRENNQPVPFGSLQLLPPVHNPEKILCVGINYKKRYPLDTAPPLPDNIILFGKHTNSLTGHLQSLEIPEGEAASSFDYEGEIAVIIGRSGRHIGVEEALDYIAGYTVLNDGSVRGWQKHSLHAGKNFYHSGACGPYMVTSDEIADSSALELRTWLNGKLVQQTTADQMLFSIAEQISYISHLMPLAAGDIVATGSPEGSGGSRDPQCFLQRGDHLEIEVSGVGILSNVVG